MSPQEWTDHMVTTAWKPVWQALDIANDDFIRTTEPRHEERVADFWTELESKGEVYKGSYTGPYCVACEEFKNPGDLIDGNCPIHGRPVKEISEDNYFFPLSKYADRLLEHYEANPGFIGPDSARNEVLSFVRGGLQDISMSRSAFDWGIKVPWDDSHVIYVWIDALQNYLNAAGWRSDNELYEKTWPADVHLVGKDIIRFHAVIWPAMLMAAGLPLPHKVFANGWLLVGGEKMSKTKLTGISPHQIIDVFGSDAYRYYFMRELSYGQDGSFSWESMQQRYTSELANDFGNLASRVTSMIERYRHGRVPDGTEGLGDAEKALADGLAVAAASADERICALDFQNGLIAIFAFVAQVNGYVSEQAPWALAKAGDDTRLDAVLYAAAESLRAIAVLLNPVTPRAAAKLWMSLGAEEQLGSLAQQRIADVARWGQLPVDAKVTKGEILFPRIEEAVQ